MTRSAEHGPSKRKTFAEALITGLRLDGITFIPLIVLGVGGWAAWGVGGPVAGVVLGFVISVVTVTIWFARDLRDLISSRRPA